MKWVALVTVLGIAVYTWLTLEFRKPGKPAEPWTDNRARAEIAVLAEAGWTKSEVSFEAVVEFPTSRGNVSLGAPMPVVSLLRDATLDPWHLPIEVTASMAPAEWSAGQPYTAYLKLDLDTDRMQIGGFTVFRKNTHLILVPRWERVPGDLIARSRTASGRLLFAAGDVPPGEYTVTVVAIKSCATWRLTVHGG
jgi:hypothetical protein